MMLGLIIGDAHSVYMGVNIVGLDSTISGIRRCINQGPVFDQRYVGKRARNPQRTAVQDSFGNLGWA